MTERATLDKNVSENNLNLWNSANGWKNHDRRPWPETRIFIEMDSACRSQQGSYVAVQNSAMPFLLFFLVLWLNLCNNSDQTLFSNALTFARSLGNCWKPRPSASVCNISLGTWQTRSLGSCWKPRPSASVCNISLGTWQTLMHEKSCLIPIIMQSLMQGKIRSKYSVEIPTLKKKPLSCQGIGLHICVYFDWATL